MSIGSTPCASPYWTSPRSPRDPPRPRRLRTPSISPSATEHLGYERYWLAEHHASGGLAGSAPEILIAHVAANTCSIRVGSGGVMLSHYSPLEGRRAVPDAGDALPGADRPRPRTRPGSEPLTAFALQRNRQHQSSDDFIDQLAELEAWLNGTFPEQHPFARITATPVPDARPRRLAAQLVAATPRRSRHTSARAFASPTSSPTTAAPSRSPTTRRASCPRRATTPLRQLLRSASSAPTPTKRRRRWRLLPHSGASDGGRARTVRFRPSPRPRTTPGRAQTCLAAGPAASRTIVGDPEQVKNQLNELAERYGVDDLVLVTITHDHAARVHSYELIAKEFGLSQPSS